jgi:hypothetical protein
MDDADAIRQPIRLVPGADGTKRHLMHPFNGRFHPVDHAALDDLVDAMAARIDVTRVDYVLGFPEGGSIPAYAFGRAVKRPVILASGCPSTCRAASRSSSPPPTSARPTTCTGSGPASGC